MKNECIGLDDETGLALASVETADRWHCFTDRSADGITQWQAGEPVPMEHLSLKDKGMIQPSLWQDGTGRVHMLMRSTEGYVFYSFSDDVGGHWSPAQRCDLPNNNSGIDLARLEDGRLVLIYNPVSGNWAGRTPIALTWSADNGVSWSKPEVLEHDPDGRDFASEAERSPAEFSYPAVIARGNQVFITYTWYRKSVAFWQLAF